FFERVRVRVATPSWPSPSFTPIPSSLSPEPAATTRVVDDCVSERAGKGLMMSQITYRATLSQGALATSTVNAPHSVTESSRAGQLAPTRPGHRAEERGTLG